MSFNPNANANSFTPGGGATPPFKPGQPYNPYAQQFQPPNGQQQQQQQQQYDQYYQQQNSGYGSSF